MTVAELIEMIGEDKTYWEQTLVYVNGQPADDVSFGLIAGTNQMIINIEHYEEFDLPDNQSIHADGGAERGDKSLT